MKEPGKKKKIIVFYTQISETQFYASGQVICIFKKQVMMLVANLYSGNPIMHKGICIH